MNRKRLEIVLVAGLVAVATGALALAQAPARPPAIRTILQKADVAASPAQETLIGTVDVPVGSGNARHKHNGTEMGVILQGRIRQEVEGQPPRELGPGDSFLIPRGVPHQSTLLGDQPVKMISTWTVDKGGDLMIPVK